MRVSGVAYPRRRNGGMSKMLEQSMVFVALRKAVENYERRDQPSPRKALPCNERPCTMVLRPWSERDACGAQS